MKIKKEYPCAGYATKKQIFILMLTGQLYMEEIVKKRRKKKIIKNNIQGVFDCVRIIQSESDQHLS